MWESLLIGAWRLSLNFCSQILPSRKLQSQRHLTTRNTGASRARDSSQTWCRIIRCLDEWRCTSQGKTYLRIRSLTMRSSFTPRQSQRKSPNLRTITKDFRVVTQLTCLRTCLSRWKRKTITRRCQFANSITTHSVHCLTKLSSTWRKTRRGNRTTMSTSRLRDKSNSLPSTYWITFQMGKSSKMERCLSTTPTIELHITCNCKT